MRFIIIVIVKFSFILYSNAAFGLKFDILADSNIVGTKQVITIDDRDDLKSIARKFDLTIAEIITANPSINPKNIKQGTEIIIPTEFILPAEEREGIVLNLAEFRLYYFMKDQTVVYTFPVGIGRLGAKTPVGDTKVTRKREQPTWVPPASIRKSYERKGKYLPPSIPPGPKNPLGEYAMNLSWTNYLIHGTNVPSSIGLRSSSGCIRMYPEDIETLFYLTEIGTKVKIIHEPVKVGFNSGELYLEAHESFKEKYYNDEDLTEEELLENIIEDHYKRFIKRIDWNAANKNLKKAVGYPIDITK